MRHLHWGVDFSDRNNELVKIVKKSLKEQVGQKM